MTTYTINTAYCLSSRNSILFLFMIYPYILLIIIVIFIEELHTWIKSRHVIVIRQQFFQSTAVNSDRQLKNSFDFTHLLAVMMLMVIVVVVHPYITLHHTMCIFFNYLIYTAAEYQIALLFSKQQSDSSSPSSWCPVVYYSVHATCSLPNILNCHICMSSWRAKDIRRKKLFSVFIWNSLWQSFIRKEGFVFFILHQHTSLYYVI